MRCGYSRGRYTTGAVLLLYCCRRASSWLGQAADAAASHGLAGTRTSGRCGSPSTRRRPALAERAPRLPIHALRIGPNSEWPIPSFAAVNDRGVSRTRQYSAVLTALRRNLSVELTACGALHCRAGRIGRIECGSGAATRSAAPPAPPLPPLPPPRWRGRSDSCERSNGLVWIAFATSCAAAVPQPYPAASASSQPRSTALCRAAACGRPAGRPAYI
jgi:hypothetical protein